FPCFFSRELIIKLLHTQLVQYFFCLGGLISRFPLSLQLVSFALILGAHRIGLSFEKGFAGIIGFLLFSLGFCLGFQALSIQLGNLLGRLVPALLDDLRTLLDIRDHGDDLTDGLSVVHSVGESLDFLFLKLKYAKGRDHGTSGLYLTFSVSRRSVNASEKIG